jgi:hypothetical protein
VEGSPVSLHDRAAGNARVPLHRHQIAWLGEAGWRRVLDRNWDATERDCLDHWAARQLPLVVTRQADSIGEDSISLGLPAPRRWGRRRLALTVARGDVLYFDEFPWPSAWSACCRLRRVRPGSNWSPNSNG